MADGLRLDDMRSRTTTAILPPEPRARGIWVSCLTEFEASSRRCLVHV